MKEHPILFSGEMVRAILDGRKSQTRRVINPQIVGTVTKGPWNVDGDIWAAYTNDGENFKTWQFSCPYGQPGDLLWVRETWTLGDTDGESWADIFYRADDSCVRHQCSMEQGEKHSRILDRLEACGNHGDNWRPSIHMPRWASRITLRITDVWVERLQEISGMDAKREGISIPAHLPEDGADLEYARREYRKLWNSLNLPPKPIYDKKRIVSYVSYPWSAEDFDAKYPGVREAGVYRGKPIQIIPNPWLWAISFEKIA